MTFQICKRKNRERESRREGQYRRKDHPSQTQKKRTKKNESKTKKIEL
jgi:hypothetical protein